MTRREINKKTNKKINTIHTIHTIHTIYALYESQRHTEIIKRESLCE